MVQEALSKKKICKVAELCLGDKIEEDIKDKEGFLLFPSGVICDFFVIKELKSQVPQLSIQIERDNLKGEQGTSLKGPVVKIGFEAYQKELNRVESIWGRVVPQLSFSSYAIVDSSLALRIDNVFDIKKLSYVSLEAIHSINQSIQGLLEGYADLYNQNPLFKKCLMMELLVLGYVDKGQDSLKFEEIQTEYLLSLCFLADILASFPFEGSLICTSGVLLTYIWSVQSFLFEITPSTNPLKREKSAMFYALSKVSTIYLSCFHFSSYADFMEDMKDGYNQGTLEKTFGVSEETIYKTIWLHWGVSEAVWNQWANEEGFQEASSCIDTIIRMNIPTWNQFYYLSEEKRKKSEFDKMKLEARTIQVKKMYLNWKSLV